MTIQGGIVLWRYTHFFVVGAVGAVGVYDLTPNPCAGRFHNGEFEKVID